MEGTSDSEKQTDNDENLDKKIVSNGLKLNKIKQDKKSLYSNKNLISFGGLISLLGCLLSFSMFTLNLDFVGFERPIYLLGGIGFGVLFIISLISINILNHRLIDFKDEERVIEFDNELDKLSLTPEIGSAMILLKKNHFQLRRYYDQNIRQNNEIFYVGFFCIFIGVVVIGFTLYLVAISTRTWEEKFIMAILGSIGGILTNYIASIYFQMHKAVSKSLTIFYSKLITNHNLYLANLIVMRIIDDDKRYAALEKLALAIISQKDEINYNEFMIAKLFENKINDISTDSPTE